MQAQPASVFLLVTFVQVKILGGLWWFVKVCPGNRRWKQTGKKKELVPLAEEPAVWPFLDSYLMT